MMKVSEEKAMREQLSSEFTVSEALNMYQRLRARGQNSVLARLSVEARCGELSPEQRTRIRQMLRAYDKQVA
jgi:uncharacterized membrane protein